MTMSGADLIAEERERQVCHKQYDDAHDNALAQGELLAGVWKIVHDVQMDRGDTATLRGLYVPCAAKVASKYKNDYIHRLVIGGALLAAEIDRLLRIEDIDIPQGESEASIGLWIDETFPGADPESPRRSLRLIEEAVELCLVSGAPPSLINHTVSRALEAQCSGKLWFKGERQADKIPAEVADVQITLIAIAAMLKFRIGDETNKKMAINRSRRWTQKGDGTGYHVKPMVTPPAPGSAGPTSDCIDGKTRHDFDPLSKFCTHCKKHQSQVYALESRICT